MLESPDDNTRCDSLFLREPTNGRCAIVAGGDESHPCVVRHKKIRRPRICLVFESTPVVVGAIDEYAFPAVEKQVRRLVKQIEPQVVVRLVARAQSNDLPAG